jgi:4-hydroxy 2-oxovalerate aldolase
MGVHPNYATYLIDKQSVAMTKIAEILDKLPSRDRHLFDRQNIETLYHNEMSRNVEDSVAIAQLAEKIDGKEVLVIAPGGSVRTHMQFIKDYIKAFHPFVVSLNSIPEEIAPDLTFVSNRKRFEQLKFCEIPVAITSNISITSGRDAYVINYDSVLSNPSDPSGIMMLRFLLRLGAKRAVLAGYDGFTGSDNHFDQKLDRVLAPETINLLNAAMQDKLAEIEKNIELKFITPSIYEVNK